MVTPAVSETTADAADAEVGEDGRCPAPAPAAAAAASDDSEEEYDDDGGMTSLEYIMTYKQLPPHEVELLLEEPVQRLPFTDSQLFKDLSADASATEEDFDEAFEEHEERQDMRVRFHDWVRSEYEARGYVAVSDEYIARRARTQEWASKMWKEAFADFGEEDDEVEEEGASAFKLMIGLR